MFIGVDIKYPLLLSDFNDTNFSERDPKNVQIS